VPPDHPWVQAARSVGTRFGDEPMPTGDGNGLGDEAQGGEPTH